MTARRVAALVMFFFGLAVMTTALTAIIMKIPSSPSSDS